MWGGLTLQQRKEELEELAQSLVAEEGPQHLTLVHAARTVSPNPNPTHTPADQAVSMTRGSCGVCSGGAQAWVRAGRHGNCARHAAYYRDRGGPWANTGSRQARARARRQACLGFESPCELS